MDSYRVDRLVMLLSSDWFRPHWHLVGLDLSAEKSLKIQKGCREIVRQIMAESQSLSEVNSGRERTQQTESVFRTLLSRSEIDNENRERINQFTLERSIDEGTRWLVVQMTEQLLEGVPVHFISDNPVIERGVDEPDVNDAARRALGGELAKWQQKEAVDCEKLCLSSSSGWDSYLRSLTPDLPAMLALHASAMMSDRVFEDLWRFVNTSLTIKERQELLNWYRRRAQILTGEPLRLAQ